MTLKIYFYQTSRGDKIVKEFISSLNEKTSAKIVNYINLLAQHGPHLGMPYSKKISKDIYELRIRGKEEIRIFYCFTKDKNICLLHAFKKKSQKTPSKEIMVSENRLKEILD